MTAGLAEYTDTVVEHRHRPDPGGAIDGRLHRTARVRSSARDLLIWPLRQCPGPSHQVIGGPTPGKAKPCEQAELMADRWATTSTRLHVPAYAPRPRAQTTSGRSQAHPSRNRSCARRPDVLTRFLLRRDDRLFPVPFMRRGQRAPGFEHERRRSPAGTGLPERASSA
jgi:hypothetical protein